MDDTRQPLLCVNPRSTTERASLWFPLPLVDKRGTPYARVGLRLDLTRRYHPMQGSDRWDPFVPSHA